MTRTNYSGGYVVYNSPVCFESWLLLPAENLWPAWIRGILYTMAILYIFLGIAIAADVFMLSIEMITSKKRLVLTYDYEQKKSIQKEVYVWNETVANLTLMALGSSAPEILIAVIETVTNLDPGLDATNTQRDLGTFTIIGSASFNLLVICAVCIMSVPSKTVKKIGQFGVFIITSIWSLFAYFWLLIVLKWSSPNIVEVWEAVLTLIFFPLLVISAWCQNRSWWKQRFMKKRRSSVAVRSLQPKDSHPYASSHVIGVRPAEGHTSFNFDPEVVETTHGPGLLHKRISDLHLRKLSEKKSKLRNIVSYVKDHETNNNTTAKDIAQGIRRCMEPNENKSLARARFRHAAITSLVKGTHLPKTSKSNQLISLALQVDSGNRISMNSNFGQDDSIGYFAFSSSSYSVVRRSRELEVTVLLHMKRRRRVIGFSHVVEAAKRATTVGVVAAPNRPQALANRGNSSGQSIKSQTTCTTVVDEFNDSFIGVPDQHNVSNSDSGFTMSRNLEEGSYNQAAQFHSDSKRLSVSEGIEMSDIKQTLLNFTSAVTVEYETRDGTAKQGIDYENQTGDLNFLDHQYYSSIKIPIREVDTEDNNEEKYFFLILRSSSETTTIGDPSIARVCIINDNEPGEILFQEATYHVDYSTATVTATAIRLHGCDGNISVCYRTINGTAFGGDIKDLDEGSCDFLEVKEKRLEFGNGETSKKINLQVNMNSKPGKSFILLMYNPTGGATLGHRSATIITLTTAVDDIVDQVANLMTEENQDKSLMRLWNDQFYDAMSIGGNCDDESERPSFIIYVLHFLSFFWKVLLACIPPRTLFGGWLAFVLSLLVLGLLSALVEQFAKLLGCVLNLEVSVTGITIIALGTSMPDTFASRSAAIQDDTADASIGNVTGSNSVNVFLGLGLPWVIKTLYYQAKGKSFRVYDANLAFSVTVFLSCGVVCLLFLVLRRKLYGGELGGPRLPKFASGIALITLWMVFVTLCSLRAYNLIPAL